MTLSTRAARASAARSTSRDGRLTVALVVLCQVAHFLTFAAMPLLLPAVREDLRIDFTEAGMLSAAGMLSYAAGQIPAGYLSDRFGPRRLFFIGLLGWSLLSVSFGLIHAFWLALINQFAAGAFRALLFAPGLMLLAAWSRQQRRATAMSLFVLGGAAGSVVLALAGPGLVEHYGWRATFIGCAALGVIAACAFGAFAKERTGRGEHAPLVLKDIVAAARFPILWICNWLQFIRFATVMGFNFWLPSFLVTDRGFSLAQAGLVMGLSAALSAPSNTLGAYVSDRFGNPPLVIGIALGILAACAALLPRLEPAGLLLLAVAVYSVFLGAYFGPLFAVPVEVLGTRVAGTTIGFTNLFANLGGFSAVYALGAIRDHAGSFAAGFQAIAALCAAGVVLAIVLARMRSHALDARGDGEQPPSRPQRLVQSTH